MVTNATGSPAVRTVGRYAIHAEIASGGMATVYFGRLRGAAGFSRTVAIKQLHPHFRKDPEFVSMFADEARVAGRIVHPNVIQTIDVVTDDELFLVLDYVHGESLARLQSTVTSRGERIPVDLACTIMSNVLHGLHAAHETKDEHGRPLDIVHRDVSPQNVLVGADGLARVLDFGIAKAVGRLYTTREGHIKGKLAYMAPEQLEGNASRQSDIYSASVVLWELLTGRRLFEGEEAVVLAKVLGGMIPPPSSIVPGLPKEVDALTMRGLAHDPGQRFTTAREIALALEGAVGFTPPSKVGAWVSVVASEVLAKRSQIIAEMAGEHGDSTERPSTRPAPPKVPEDKPAIDTSKKPRPRWRWVFVLGGLALAGAVMMATLWKSDPRRPTSAGAPSSSPPVDSSSIVATTEDVPPPGASVTITASSASALADAGSPRSATPSVAASSTPRHAGRPVRRKPDLGGAIDTRH